MTRLQVQVRRGAAAGIQDAVLLWQQQYPGLCLTLYEAQQAVS